MGALRSVVMAFSLFSKIPMPQVDWQAYNMRYVLAAFPLVGVVVGALTCLWCVVANALGLGALLFAAGVALVPVAVTGGIHLDGLCDVTDALSSHAEPARKREILKDPRVGAFAVIGVVSYLVLYVGIASELAGSLPLVPGTLVTLGLIPVMGRVCSGLVTLLYPRSSNEGMLSMFQGSADVKHAAAVLFVELVAVAAALVCASGWLGACVAGVSAAWALVLRPFANRQFGGMSGDLSGFFLQVAELLMLAVLVLLPKVVAVL